SDVSRCLVPRKRSELPAPDPEFPQGGSVTASPRPNGNHRGTPLPPAPSPSSGAPGAPAPGRGGRDARRPAAPAARRRDACFDTAKCLATVLVAAGHAWEPLIGVSRSLQAAYMLVYAFHMPAFILLPGFFSRRFDLRPDRLRRLVPGVAVPFPVFETAYPLFKR